MIKLASDYGISEDVLKQFFDADGKVITAKFEEFIALLNQKEIDEKKARPKEQTMDLLNQVKDALIESRQKEIDALSEKFDAIIDANNKVVAAVQEQVENERRQREREKTEQSIEDKYNQLAYLAMDSSGGNALAMMDLQKEIKEAEEAYQDSLIDQSIQQLQDANQKAEEQRNRQITLMEAQLDIWQNSDQLWNEVNAVIVNANEDMASGKSFENTDLGKLLNEHMGNLNSEEKGEFVAGILEALSGYKIYYEPEEPEEPDNPSPGPTTNPTVEPPKNVIPSTTGAPSSSGGGGRHLITPVPFRPVMVAYETGGLANYTGPAWLDGTPSRPEYVLNAAQTERLFSLIDVLEHYDTNAKKSSAGDNYFDIEINVEKIEDDYDVEQVANKIRNMIYEDATYRNVNAINHIR